MYRDYSGGCISAIGGNRKRSHKKRISFAAKELIPAVKLMWHAIGVMLLITLVIGVTSTIWYGWQVRSALDDIGQVKETKGKLANENKMLTVKHDLMLSQKYMVKAAKEQGLSLPAKNQLRYP